MRQKLKIKLLHGGFIGKRAFQILYALHCRQTIELVEGDDYDILITASYPKRITPEEIAKAKIASLNLHTGLLPKQRGYHPLNWALIWGDKQGGLTLHKTAESIDSGDIVMSCPFNISNNDTIRDLQVKATLLVEPVLVTFINNYLALLDCAQKQNQANATYAPRRFPSDSELNLKASKQEIWNLFRSCDPDLYPAFVMEDGRKRIVKDIVDGRIVYANR